MCRISQLAVYQMVLWHAEGNNSIAYPRLWAVVCGESAWKRETTGSVARGCMSEYNTYEERSESMALGGSRVDFQDTLLILLYDNDVNAAVSCVETPIYAS